MRNVEHMKDTLLSSLSGFCQDNALLIVLTVFKSKRNFQLNMSELR